MKKFIIGLTVSFSILIIGLIAYFINANKTHDIEINLNNIKSDIVLENISLLGKETIGSYQNRREKYFYKDYNQVVDRIEKNKYFKTKLSSQEFILEENNIFYKVDFNLREESFKFEIFSIKFENFELPFFDTIELRRNSHQIYNLSDSKFLKDKTFQGLKNYLNNLPNIGYTIEIRFFGNGLDVKIPNVDIIYKFEKLGENTIKIEASYIR